jgi:hypothetical protein
MYRWFWKWGRLFFFKGKTYNGSFWGYSQDNLGVKRSLPPRKIPRNAPLLFCPRQKNNFLHFQNQRYIGIFYGHEKEGERERARKIERESESKRKKDWEGEQEREGEGEQEQEVEGEREREKEKEKERERKKGWAIIFLNRLGKHEKSADYIHLKERFSMCP